MRFEDEGISKLIMDIIYCEDRWYLYFQRVVFSFLVQV